MKTKQVRRTSLDLADLNVMSKRNIKSILRDRDIFFLIFPISIRLHLEYSSYQNFCLSISRNLAETNPQMKIASSFKYISNRFMNYPNTSQKIRLST